jgi:hypothetical protein
MHCPTHVGESNIDQAPGTGHNHETQQNAQDPEQGATLF